MIVLATQVLAWIGLVAGLVLPTVTPEISNVTVVTLMVVSIAVLALSPSRREILSQPGVWLPLAGGALLLLAFVLSAKSPVDPLLIFFFFSPMLLLGPLSALLERVGPKFSVTLIGWLALAGSTGAAAVCAYDVFVRHLKRGGSLVNNPIHLADLAVTLGFVALIGLYGPKGWKRAVFWLGPVMALTAVQLSGSRGPALAFAATLLVAGLVLAFHLLRRRMAWIVTLMGGAIALGAAALVIHGDMDDRLGRLGKLLDLLRAGAIDNSTGQRLVMYKSAWAAFLESPIFGYGVADMVAAAARHAPKGVKFPAYDHLHNDIADFAVIGGLCGLVAYGLFLAAPIIEGLRAKSPARAAAVYLAIVTSFGYLMMGLTNAMFGILSQTALFGVVCALVITLSRLSRTTSLGQGAYAIDAGAAPALG